MLAKKINDSGERREFGSGAVRDITEGKGRCDLMPLDVAAEILGTDWVLYYISEYVNKGEKSGLYKAIDSFIGIAYPNKPTALLEVAKHYEDGCRKYGERNWEKGIPLHSYIDSAVRHYLKFRRGDEDEPHDRAVLWNLMCAIWTHEHRTDCREFPVWEVKDEKEH